MPNDDLNITNQATAHFKLTIDNDPNLALLISEMAQDSGLVGQKYDRERLAVALEDLYTEFPDQVGTLHQTDVFSALLQVIINHIDWLDLADHYIRKEEEHDGNQSQQVQQ